jgi:hypothetical protein
MNVVHLQRVINIHMKAIDIIKPRHELYEAGGFGPFRPGFASDFFELAVKGLGKLFGLVAKRSPEQKAFIEKWAQDYAQYASQAKMDGKPVSDFETWFLKKMQQDPNIAPEIRVLDKAGKPTGEVRPNPDYGKPTELGQSNFARDPEIRAEIGKEAGKLLPKVHGKNLEKISTTRFEKTIEAIKEKYKPLRALLVGFGIADTALSGVWPAYQHWAQTDNNIKGFQDLGTTQTDYVAQIKAAGFDPANISAEAQDWINTKLKPSSKADMDSWVDKESTINAQRVKTQLYAVAMGAAATAALGVGIIKIVKKVGLTGTATVLNELLKAGGIVLFGEFVNEVNNQGMSRALGELIGSQLLTITTTVTDNATGSQTSTSKHDTAGTTSASQAWTVAENGLIRSMDRIIRVALALPKYANALRKDVGNAIAGNDTAQSPATTPVTATSTPAQPAASAADDKKSTTPADQPAPTNAPKVDANGKKQGEIGYTTDSGWTIEGIYPNGVLWGNPKSNVNKDKLLPPGQEP